MQMKNNVRVNQAWIICSICCTNGVGGTKGFKNNKDQGGFIGFGKNKDTICCHFHCIRLTISFAFILKYK